MNAREVHAVLAAGVQNPSLIVNWRENPAILARRGITPDLIDLTGLWKFAGLTVKVRHNGLRPHLPLTFRLLSVADLEIEVFGAYAEFCSARSQSYAPTLEGRAQNLFAFLENWLRPEIPEHAQLRELIRHEAALMQLCKPDATMDGDTEEPVASISEPRALSVPTLRGRVILHEMRANPREVGAVLFQSRPDLRQIALGCHYFAYWRPAGTNQSQILELDEFGYYALSAIDGALTAADLSRRLGVGSRPTKPFLRSLGQLAATGVLYFKN